MFYLQRNILHVYTSQHCDIV